MKNRLFSFCALTLAATPSFGQFLGESTAYNSPRGLQELCIRITKVENGQYSAKDIEKENEFCSLDFYNNTVALCPKTWSTSPGTIVHKLPPDGSMTSEKGEALCRGKETPLKSVAKFKQTMNQSGTSGTYSQSSLLYYHMSRYLDATITVPVAVYRSMDKDVHLDRVTRRARPQGRMNAVGWDWVKRSEENPSVYKPTSDLFTLDNSQIYGVLLKDQGERYGIEINGNREGLGGEGQTAEIQNTPAFRSLLTSGNLKQAIETGISKSFEVSAYRSAFGGQRPTHVQMTLWMKEMSEMVILDHLFNQQDRVGNIDYVWNWVYVEAGKVKTKKEDSKVSLSKKSTIPVPEELKSFQPELVQKTSIGDNDAGGRANYVNRTKRAGIVAKLRHLDPEVYKRMVKLAKDFEAQGNLYQYFKTSFQLDDRHFQSLVNNALEVANTLEENCQSGNLKFSLSSYKQVKLGQYPEVNLNCSNP